MDEETLEASISTYKAQLQQVEDAMLISGHSEEMVKLCDDLKSLLEMSEESLLALKKQRLMAMVPDPDPDPDPLAAEFAAFQAELGDDVTTAATNKEEEEPRASTYQASNNSSDSSDDDSDDDVMPHIELPNLEGVLCRVPYMPEWGHVEHHNALILRAEPIDTDSEPQVRVLFCQPTKKALVTCPYFIEDKCKFSEEECRFCHGYKVDVSKVEEYQETDYSQLKLESRCLAKYTDDVWYPAIVVEEPTRADKPQYKVMFEDYEETITAEPDEIIPLESNEASDDEEDRKGGEDYTREDPRLESSDEEDDALPCFLYKPHTMQKMGEWEKHTKGIASKLMERMGFVAGRGLGKTGQGRIDPVPIQLLPQGKSLDKIMELKAIAGDQDLYDVLKKQKKKQKQVEANAANIYKQECEKMSVFDIINKKLGNKKGDVRSLVSHKKEAASKHIGVRELHAKSNKDINIQLLQTAEEISKVEKEVNRIRQSVQRYEASEPKVAKQYKKKLEEMEKYLTQLRHSEKTITTHKNSRIDRKKLSVF